jgi:hypothetical protein
MLVLRCSFLLTLTTLSAGSLSALFAEWEGMLNVYPSRVMAGSSGVMTFKMEFYPSLPASAGPVKIYSCNAQGFIGQFLTELFDDGTAANGDSAAADSVYSGKLRVQASSSNAAQYFTVVVGQSDVELAPGTDVSNSTDTIEAVTTYEGDQCCAASPAAAAQAPCCAVCCTALAAC